MPLLESYVSDGIYHDMLENSTIYNISSDIHYAYAAKWCYGVHIQNSE